jgi:RNA polymerase sigma-70 factor, ECF subfamily
MLSRAEEGNRPVSISIASPLEYRPRALLFHQPAMAHRDYQLASDQELMAWTSSGDRRSFDELAGRHLGRALRTAIRILGNPEDAEEVAQEAMLRIWMNARNWKPSRSQLSTWLYQIVVNLSIDRRRKPVPQHFEEALDPADPSRDAVSEIEQREREQSLARALQEMPSRQRAALVLCCYEGLSGQEAALVLSISLKAVEGLLLRARAFLRERLRARDV